MKDSYFCKISFFDKSKMKILVTGANGLLGHHVVMQLLKLNHHVKIIVRSTRNIFFDLSAVEIIEGNFSDYKN